jgi:hypothetical protein
LLSWLVAETATLERRDRILILASGLFPDLDALTFVGTLFGREDIYQNYHRVILHNVCGALGYAALTAIVAKRKVATTLLALVGFHLHLLCDTIGSAGPDGSKWDVPYFVPFSHEGFVWQGQWGLASWQNVTITLVALVVCGWLGVRRGRTILEAFSLRADAAVVETLRKRFGRPAEPVAPPT